MRHNIGANVGRLQESYMSGWDIVGSLRVDRIIM